MIYFIKKAFEDYDLKCIFASIILSIICVFLPIILIIDYSSCPQSCEDTLKYNHHCEKKEISRECNIIYIFIYIMWLIISIIVIFSCAIALFIKPTGYKKINETNIE